MDHQPRAELEKLLISLLAEADVRRIVRLLPGGEDMHAELPGTGVSLTALVHQAVSVLERHGRLDGMFFEAMVAERPARRDQIWALAARMSGPAPLVPPDERGRSYTRHPLGQVLPEADAELMSEITAVTRVIPAVRVPAHKNQQKPSAPTADPLAQALDDALVRKQRLETAGLPFAEVLDEIRKLKRELRLGGMLRPGDVLGHRYLLAEKIGQGGFGTVWRARDRRMHEDIAVKVLHPNLAGANEQRQRFFRGARIMAELAHPAVVGVRQLEDEDDGFHYFVMDLLASGNLHDAVLSRCPTQEQTQSLILQVGAALAAAHKRGIVHRDVKPSNILLDDEGRPYLTDFDLVTAPDTTGGTRTGALGTFLYAPPEMLERPQEANARADVYGLGMTMAFMLHGAPLTHMSMRDGSRFVWGLTCAAQLKSVLECAVAWEPKRRFVDAGAFCQALQEAMAAHAENISSHWPSQNTAALTSVQKQAHAEKRSLNWPSQFTLRELLHAIRHGFPINGPILVDAIQPKQEEESGLEPTSPTPSTMGPDIDLMHFYWKEYASHDVVLLKSKRRIPASMPAVTIGRSRSCDIRIKDSSVSSSHARILFDSSTSEYVLVDEGSRNGTFMNGERINAPQA